MARTQLDLSKVPADVQDHEEWLNKVVAKATAKGKVEPVGTGRQLVRLDLNDPETGRQIVVSANPGDLKLKIVMAVCDLFNIPVPTKVIMSL